MKNLVTWLYLCSMVMTTTVFAETINAIQATVSNPMEAMVGTCPDSFTPEEGDNPDFVSGAVKRRFHLHLPDDLSTPRPVFVSLTGTVQPELDFTRQSGLDLLTKDGWIVLTPYRRCSNEGRTCNPYAEASRPVTTMDGRTWEPWYESTHYPTDNEGPDVTFIREAVQCAASGWPVARDAVYVGGISAGGSMSNRIMTYNSDFFAGAIPASGNWGPGRVPKSPRPMEKSIVLIMWGGATDIWPLENPIANYAPDTKYAGEFFAAQDQVVTVSCTGPHGHAWPANNYFRPPFSSADLNVQNQFTLWAASTLLSHPKGSDPAGFTLTTPPPGFSCVVGAYSDH